ncbi:MAG: DsbA family protein [Pyrinomonadaceae bacterium]
MNNKYNEYNLSLVSAALTLLAFVMSSCTSGTSTTVNKTADAPSKSAAEIYGKALPGAVPPNALGAANAPVTLEEFADFQCPTCALMHPKVQELRAAYGDRLRIIFREFPLKIPAHDKSYEAAVAAEAAGMQGKFWDMQNLLFANPSTWSIAPTYRQIFEDYAQKLGLNVEKFKDDMAGLMTKNRVNADLERGNSLGLNSTPSFFINGNPAQDLTVEGMKNMIDAELQKNQTSSQPAQTSPTVAANNAVQTNAGKPTDAEKK